MSDYAIQVENVGKRYRIGLAETQHDSLLQATVAWAKAPVANYRRLRSLSHFDEAEVSDDIVWALRDINFTVRQGEVVGIIGRNGAGKSTLLKVISRITTPSTGRITLRGRVASLLEVGTGFHQELTGRENVYLNGTVLGMSKSEVDQKFDEIVSFSGVEKFIDTPVKRYSSGMRVRLAFAVAAHLEPEILLVDEVLAVGDAAFQKKSLGKMQDVANEGRTVLFVSHNMPTISALCERAILLENGHIKAEGAANRVIGEYLARGKEEAATSLAMRTDRQGNQAIKFTDIQFIDCTTSKGLSGPIASGSNVNVELTYESQTGQPIENVLVALVFVDNYGKRLMTCSMEFNDADFRIVPGAGKIVCQIEQFPLLPGEYSLLLWSSVNRELADRIEDAAICQVESGDFFGTGKLPRLHKHGPFLVNHGWQVH